MGGSEGKGRGRALAKVPTPDFSSNRRKFRLDVAQAQTLAQGVTVVARGGAADDVALAIEQGLVAERDGIGHPVNLEGDEAVRPTGLELLLQCLFSDERTLGQAYEPVQY